MRKLLTLGCAAIISLGMTYAGASYLATQCSSGCTTFFDYVVSTVHLPGFAITDPGQGQSAAVKAASTLPVADDHPLVVAISPNIDLSAPTYNVDVSGYVAYATPTDLYCIYGSASKVVRISEMNIRIQSTAGALQTIQFIKRSAVNTGGTPTSLTPIPYNSTNPAATATITSYGSAPALGTAVGTMRILQGTSGTLTAAAINLAMRNNFLNATLVSQTQYVTLNGVAEGLCINYNGAALTAGFTSIIGAEWEERVN